MLYSDCKAWMAVPRIGIRRAPRRGKRVDTNGFYPLNSHFLLFLSLAQTRDRRPLQNGERQSGYRSVSFSANSQFTDSGLLHRSVSLRRVRHKVNCPKGKRGSSGG